MIKLLQMLKWMRSHGFSFDQMHGELLDVVDNHHSDYFELTEADCESVTRIFYDDDKLYAALDLCGYGMEDL